MSISDMVGIWAGWFTLDEWLADRHGDEAEDEQP